MGDLRTDHVKREVLRRRALAAMKRGDVYLRKTQPILVPFKRDFDSFAAEVAHQFRRYIVYRSDGGRFARGLVRASGDLQLIHEAYLAAGQRDDDKIRLVAALFRRKDNIAEDRWVMGIRFVAPDWYDYADEPEVVAATNATTTRIYRHGLDLFIDRALLVMADFPGERGKRVRKLLALADSLPYEEAIDLWYFEPWQIIQYLDSSDKERKQMLVDAGGRPPDAPGGFKPPTNWRRYPFRAWRMYTRHPDFWTDDMIKRELLKTDEDAYQSIWNFHRVIASGSDVETAFYYDFRDYMRGLQDDKKSLYSVYK